jgi:hypothetical protein
MDHFKNFAKSVLAAGIVSSATSLDVSAGEGARFPPAPFNLTLWNATDFPSASDDPDKEIVRVTAVVSDTFTIVRAQEGTLAADHNTGGKTYGAVAAITSKLLTDIGGIAGTKTVSSIAFSSTPFAIDFASITMGSPQDYAGGRVSIICRGIMTTDADSVVVTSFLASYAVARDVPASDEQATLSTPPLAANVIAGADEGILFELSLTIASHVATFSVAVNVNTPFTIDTVVIEFIIQDLFGHTVVLL